MCFKREAGEWRHSYIAAIVVFNTHSLLKKWYSSLPQRPTSKKRSRRRGRREAREENLRAGSSGITLVNILLVLLLQHPLLGLRLRAEEDPVEPGLQRNCFNHSA